MAEIEIECMRRLYSSDYTRHKNRIPSRTKGSCEWFLTHPRYLDWKRPYRSTMLWVSAGPGCGKSVLGSFLIDELKDVESQATFAATVCYFFFRDDNDDQRNAILALNALLHQIFVINSSLIAHAAYEYQIKGARFTEEMDTLCNIFRSAVSAKNCGNIICVLDGLDECEEATRNPLIQFLVEILVDMEAKKEKSSFLKVLMTSRPIPSIENRFKPIPSVFLSAEDENIRTSHDIQLVVQARIETLSCCRHLSTEVHTYLVGRILENANRTFLWVSLIISELEKSARHSKSAIEELLSTMPKTMDAAYGKILAQSSDTQCMKKILDVVLAATRPLSLSEMSIAFAIKDADRSFEDLDLEPSMVDTIKNSCGPLIDMVDSKIYLLHQTAKEFLVGNGNSPSQSGWKHSVKQKDSSLIMAKICISFLEFQILESEPFVFDSSCHISTEDMKKLKQYADQHRFLDYSAKNWLLHLRDASDTIDKNILDRFCALCDTERKSLRAWFELYWGSGSALVMPCPKTPQPLMIAAHAGVTVALNILLQIGADVNAKDDLGNTPLVYAVLNGQLDIIKILLMESAEVKAENLTGATPLILAASQDSAVILDSLLQDVALGTENLPFLIDPLPAAIRGGKPQIIEYLLSRGVAADSAVEFTGRSLLSYAAQYENELIIESLLRRGASLEKMDPNGQTPLSVAAAYGKLGAIKQLCMKGAMPDTKDKQGRTPLCHAVVYGYMELVDFLVREGCDCNSRDLEGRTPLSLAVAGTMREGRIETVKALLKYQADVDSRDGEGNTPLVWSVRQGNAVISELLVEGGADVTTRSVSGETALILAAARLHEVAESTHGRDTRFQLEMRLTPDGRPCYVDHVSKTTSWEKSEAMPRGTRKEGLIMLLLEYGASVEATTLEAGLTCLHCASADARAIRLLLQHGANANAQSATKETPLLRAAWQGGKDGVSTLLDQGAKVELMTNSNWTALHAATHNGHSAIVTILLEKGADIESRTNTGTTPLLLAADKGHDMTVKTLLEHGANHSLREDKSQRTALHLAASKNQIEVAKILLGHKADVNAADVDAWTALHYAASNRYAGITEALLQKGANHRVKDSLQNRTAMHLAAKEGHEEVTKILLKYAADLEIERARLWRPIHMAANSGSVGVVQTLLEVGHINIHAVEDEGWTALHFAASKGDEEVTKVLLDAGANIEAADSVARRTALHVALDNSSAPVARMLLDHGANSNAATLDQWNALHYAANTDLENMVKYLVEQSGANISAGDKDGWTALHYAASRPNSNPIKSLIAHGADANATERLENRTPLHIAANRGHIDNVTVLLKQGRANPDAREKDQWTPLHFTASKGHTEILETLL